MNAKLYFKGTKFQRWKTIQMLRQLLRDPSKQIGARIKPKILLIQVLVKISINDSSTQLFSRVGYSREVI